MGAVAFYFPAGDVHSWATQPKENDAMRAALAFLNGAGSRRGRQSGATDRGLLLLTDLLLNPGAGGQGIVGREREDRRRDGRVAVVRPRFR